MSGGRHDDPLVPQERDGVDADGASAVGKGAVADGGPGPQSDVIDAFEHQRGDVLGFLHHHIDGSPGNPAGEKVQQAPRRVLGKRRRRHDFQPPGLGLGMCHLPPGPVRQSHDVLGMFGERPAAGSQRDPAMGAHEERVAQILPECGERRRDCRFADSELDGGRMEGTQLGHQGEGPQLSQCHRHGFITFRL